jgi:hypothetical protein
MTHHRGQRAGYSPNRHRSDGCAFPDTAKGKQRRMNGHRQGARKSASLTR